MNERKLIYTVGGEGGKLSRLVIEVVGVEGDC